MNFVDILIIIIFVSSMIYGFSRGFVREVVSFLTLIVAIVIAILFSNQLAMMISNSSFIQHLIGHSSEHAAQPASYITVVISFLLLFVGILIIGAIIGFILNAIFQWGVLGFGNRLMGALCGLIRGFIYTLILVFIIHLTSLSNEEWWKQSRFVTALQPTIDWMDKSISPVLIELKSTVGKTFEKVVPSENKTSSNTSNKQKALPSSSKKTN